MSQDSEWDIPGWSEPVAPQGVDWPHFFAQVRALDRQAFFDLYDMYLLSSAWLAKRRAALDRTRGNCGMCYVELATQVHHLTYRHVGDELPQELIAVCHRCHEACHRTARTDDRTIAALVRDARVRLIERGNTNAVVQ